MRIIVFLALISLSFSLKGKETYKQNYIIPYKTKIKLLELKSIIIESFYLTRNWVYVDKFSDTQEKIRFSVVKDSILPRILDSLLSVSKFNDYKFKENFFNIFHISNRLMQLEYGITQRFKTYADYNNISIVSDVIPEIENDGKVSLTKDSVINHIEMLLSDIDSQIRAQDKKIYLRKNQRNISILLDLLTTNEQFNENVPKISNDKVPSYKKVLAYSYDKYFTDKEIVDLIKFYKSNTGKKLISNNANMTQDLLMYLFIEKMKE
jgi:hypothetical protein